MRYRHWSQLQAGHRHGARAQQRIRRHSNNTADLVGAAIIEAPRPFKAKVKTLTYDNGKEFSGHAKIDKALGSTGYFARPFSSWERGTNENFNGQLR